MAIDINEALKIIVKQVKETRTELISIDVSLNRIIAQDINAIYNSPKFDNSAMDGYAIFYENRKNDLTLIDTIFAGDDNTRLLEKNTCIKIMTGARIPKNADAVIPKEDTILTQDKKIQIIKDVKTNQHIKFIGEDIKIDELLIKKKEKIDFSKITLLSSQGISYIKVYKKPKIVVFSSGEELKLHYESIEDHQIYNSNTPSLLARCKELHCDVTFIGQAKDSVLAIKQAIQNSLDADLIITSGGVSVGDADFTKEAFNCFDFETLFDGLNIKPGKPTVFGKINDTFVLNLPGNPLASALIFELFGKNIIQKLHHSKDLHQGFIYAKNKIELSIKKGRETILPGYFDGEYFEASQKRSPAMVSTLSSCNSMIIINKDTSLLKEESIVKVLPISWLFFKEEETNYIT